MASSGPNPLARSGRLGRVRGADSRFVSRTTWKRYRTLLAYVARYRLGWLAISLLSLVTTGLSLLAPLPMMVLVDNVIGTRPARGLLDALPGAATRSRLLV